MPFITSLCASFFSIIVFVLIVVVGVVIVIIISIFFFAFAFSDENTIYNLTTTLKILCMRIERSGQSKTVYDDCICKYANANF